MIVMMVRDVMSRRLVTIGPNTPCQEPGGRLCGIVSDRDVRSAPSPSPDTVVARIMSRDPVTVSSDTRIELRAFVRVLEAATLERIAVDVGDAA